MAAKAWSSHQKAVEEIFFQNEAVSLCLLVNRRARTMRVIDFRAGPSSVKRLFVQSLAQREGVEKVFTLVERDEVQTWQRLGFTKEGNIPGFYKRSDAFILGSAVPDRSVDKPARAAHPEEIPAQSEMRIAVAEPSADSSASPAVARMERTITLAKRGMKDSGERVLPPTKISALSEADARKAVVASLRTGRALTTFEPFGRDVERRYFVAVGRGGFELHASTESQPCFGNAYLELLESPRSESESLGAVSALMGLCERLLAESVVSCFSLAPSDDVALAAAFLQSGFRRTGLLGGHLSEGPSSGSSASGGSGQRRKDAILWSRKLANPGGE